MSFSRQINENIPPKLTHSLVDTKLTIREGCYYTGRARWQMEHQIIIVKIYEMSS